jgi:hypothetical protein
MASSLRTWFRSRPTGFGRLRAWIAAIAGAGVAVVPHDWKSTSFLLAGMLAGGVASVAVWVLPPGRRLRWFDYLLIVLFALIVGVTRDRLRSK